jgi:hypothetical protein
MATNKQVIENIQKENSKLKEINDELIAVLRSILINEQCSSCNYHKKIATNILEKVTKEVK